MRTPILKHPISVWITAALLTALLCICACEGQPETAVPLPDLPIDSSFARLPPVADDIQIQWTKDDQLLLKAVFPAEEWDKIRWSSMHHALQDHTQQGLFLPFILDNTKITLRDDGKGGDERAGDGVFTSPLPVSGLEFLEQLQRYNRWVKSLQGRPLAEFDARVQLDKPQLQPISIEKFRAREFVRIKDWVRPLRPVDPRLRTHSLMITDVGVVEDPARTVIDPCHPQPGEENKAWTFAKLMSEMAHSSATSVDVSTFTLRWLETWMSEQTIHTETVPARTAIQAQIIDPWKAKSNFAATGKLDMRFAPFKLIAIVNRLDLRGNLAYGGHAGEGRFVFCPLDASCRPMTHFTVIFEYEAPASGCAAVRQYAQQWYHLKDLPLGSPAYNAALQAITDQFTLAGRHPQKANGSALNQLRTNENALHPLWEMREWVIDPNTHLLRPVTTKNEPKRIFNGAPGGTGTTADVTTFVTWANTFDCSALQSDKCCKKVKVPEQSGGVPLMAGRSTAPAPTYFWNGGTDPGNSATFIVQNDVRFCISLNTCSGCHTGETQTRFTHITPPDRFGTAARLSGFLTGVSAPDPAGRGGARTFDDLTRRAHDLEALVNEACSGVGGALSALTFSPLNFTH